MTQERWRRVQELFAEALRLPSDGRAEGLRRACPEDAALRAEVEALLAEDDRAERDGFLRTPTDAGSAVEDAPLTGRLGPYEVRELLGRGGMGSVYRAVRVDDYRQEVAIKVVRPGVGGGDLVERFRRERQLLAALDHPHIARLLDGGSTPDGRPYLVMEYIAGVPLDRHAVERRPALRELLEIFLLICRAVAYAHGRGVVHRDLKPGNILIVRGEDKGSVPKVTDFGLAKSLAAPVDDATPLHTPAGDILGTPNYMAPEQANARYGAVGPAADVWALGAVLYDLVTGQPPFRAETPLQTVVQMLTEEPTPPRRLRPDLPRDVEVLCLKCLQKEPGRRYASADLLADEVARVLAGEPIRARPPGAAERLTRWARRHPAVAALSAALLIALATGLAGVTYLWRVAAAQSRRAEENFAQAWKVIDEYHTKASRVPALQKELPVRQELLETAVSHFREMARRNPLAPDKQDQLAMALVRASQISRDLGRKEEGRAYAEEALAIAEKVAAENGHNPVYPDHVAACLDTLGGYMEKEEALPLFERAVALREGVYAQNPERFGGPLSYTHTNVGLVHALAKRWSEALPHYQRARDLLEEALAREPPGPKADKARADLAQMILYVAECHRCLKQYEEARTQAERGCALREALAAALPEDAAAQRAVALARQALAEIQEAAGRPTEALASRERAVAVLAAQLERERRPTPRAKQFQRDQAEASYQIGLFHVRQALPDRAVAALREAVRLGHAKSLMDDEDLQSLRSRPDFQELIRDLKSNPRLDSPPARP